MQRGTGGRTRAAHVYSVVGLALAATALVGAVILGTSNLASYELGPSGDVAIAVAATFVFLLVIPRLVDLVHAQKRAHRALAQREATLREALEALRRTERERLLDETVKATEEERARVAAELHDGPIQQLTALALTLDLVTLYADRGDAEAIQAALAGARAGVAEQMDTLRRLMVELRPPALDQRGLEAALRDYVADLDRRIEARCEFAGHIGERRLGPVVETTLYRVAQEALTNAAKHAEPENVRVALSCDGAGVRLQVRDDGAGFEPSSALVQNGHFGLISTRERVERAGGRWEVNSRRGHGTILEAVLPLRPATTADSTLEAEAA